MSTVTLETTQHVVTLNTSTNEVVLDIVAAPVIIETTGGGLILASEIVTALNAANEPSATNPFATIADLDGSFPAQINVTRDWSDASQAYLDIVESLGVNLQQPISPSLLISVFYNAAGHVSSSDHAVIRVSTAPPNITYDYLVPFNDVSAIGQEVFVSGMTSLLPLTESDMAAHMEATDPHGDRAYADDLLLGHAMDHLAHGALTDSDIPAAITRDTELAASMLAEVNARTAAISAAVQGHVSEVDPHGDRAYTDTQIAAPHYARIFMMGV